MFWVKISNLFLTFFSVALNTTKEEAVSNMNTYFIFALSLLEKYPLHFTVIVVGLICLVLWKSRAKLWAKINRFIPFNEAIELLYKQTGAADVCKWESVGIGKKEYSFHQLMHVIKSGKVEVFANKVLFHKNVDNKRIKLPLEEMLSDSIMWPDPYDKIYSTPDNPKYINLSIKKWKLEKFIKTQKKINQRGKYLSEELIIGFSD